jgi:hypothetical protein
VPWVHHGPRKRGKHPRDVGVEDRGTLAEGETAYRAGRVRADAFEGEESRLVGGEFSAVPFDRLPGDRVQTARTDVVSEWPPRLRDVRFVCLGERRKGWILRQPFVVLGQHAIDLRLLQHHFRHKDVVRIAGLPPRQVAAVSAVPVEEPSPEAAAVIRLGENGRRILRWAAARGLGSLRHSGTEFRDESTRSAAL